MPRFSMRSPFRLHANANANANADANADADADADATPTTPRDQACFNPFAAVATLVGGLAAGEACDNVLRRGDRAAGVEVVVGAVGDGALLALGGRVAAGGGGEAADGVDALGGGDLGEHA